MNSVIVNHPKAFLFLALTIGVLIGSICATWAIQQERSQFLTDLEAKLELQQSIAIDTKAQEIIPPMSAEVSFAFSTQFKGELLNRERVGLIVILFDAKGQEIDRIPDGRIMRVDPVYQGVYLFSLDARYLPPGVYILVISAEYPVQISAMHPVKEETVRGSAVVTILRE